MGSGNGLPTVPRRPVRPAGCLRSLRQWIEYMSQQYRTIRSALDLTGQATWELRSTGCMHVHKTITQEKRRCTPAKRRLTLEPTSMTLVGHLCVQRSACRRVTVTILSPAGCLAPDTKSQCWFGHKDCCAGAGRCRPPSEVEDEAASPVLRTFSECHSGGKLASRTE
jgi:hypothetical protein